MTTMISLTVDPEVMSGDELKRDQLWVINNVVIPTIWNVNFK